MSETIISVQNLSKAYQIYKKPKDMILELITRQTRHNLFWALRDLSFNVMHGQRIGIIGPNGAGKSTLLKIIAGNLQPTSGTVQVNGSISALLSLAPAWNLEESGIENIRFNLLLRGIGKSQIDELTDDIIDFAELGQFIYQPVKTYSSGMSARLTFAIGTAISPEILIVDEVLGAGDGYFASKAVRRMKKLCDQGKALLFVSHSTAAVRQMCDSAIWIENGNVRLTGPVDFVTSKYDEDMLRSDDETVRPGNIKRLQKNIHLAGPDEIGTQNDVRLRIRSSEGISLSTVYFISEIKIHWKSDLQDETVIVPLDTAENQQGAYLDIMGCEWGRFYLRQGMDVRMLLPRTGARKGGHILLERPAEFTAISWPIEVEYSVMSENHDVNLILEYLDLKDAVWKPFKEVSRTIQRDGYTRIKATGLTPPVDEHTRNQAINIASERKISPIEIVDVSLFTKQGVSKSISENEPFSIKVFVQCTENAPKFCICLQINRSDGVYMFYEPSDFFGPLDTSGAKFVTIEFVFSENYFSSADYEITATAITAPWKIDLNQTDVEIFDRKISIAKFNVEREIKALQFSAINYRAQIKIYKNNQSFEKYSTADRKKRG